MVVRLLLFGAIADAVGFRERDVEVGENEFVAELLDDLVTRYPLLSRPNLLVAVNEQYADGDGRVQSGDRVAIFTPVSGG